MNTYTRTLNHPTYFYSFHMHATAFLSSAPTSSIHQSTIKISLPTYHLSICLPISVDLSSSLCLSVSIYLSFILSLSSLSIYLSILYGPISNLSIYLFLIDPRLMGDISLQSQCHPLLVELALLHLLLLSIIIVFSSGKERQPGRTSFLFNLERRGGHVSCLH